MANVKKNENVFNDFLNSTYKINCPLQCPGGEDHSPDWCGAEYAIVKFLLPIISKVNENISNEQKKSFFMLHSINNPFAFDMAYDKYFW